METDPTKCMFCYFLYKARNLLVLVRYHNKMTLTSYTGGMGTKSVDLERGSN